MSLNVSAQVHAYSRDEWSLADVKAALLYADEVWVNLPHAFLNFAGGQHLYGIDEPSGELILIPMPAELEAEIKRLQDAEPVHVVVGGNAKELQPLLAFLALPEEKQHELVRRHAATEFGREWTAHVPHGCIPIWGANPPSEVLLPVDPPTGTQRRSAIRRADLAELALTAELMGDLPAFPEADIADILDVRDGLFDSRTRFRSVMAAAGRELADVPQADFPAAVAAFRRERVDEAVLAIREDLEDLGAVPTLLRAVRENWGAPVVASLVMATAMLDVNAAAAAATSGAGVALAAREALTRRELRRATRQQPYWYLRAVDDALSERRSGRRR